MANENITADLSDLATRVSVTETKIEGITSEQAETSAALRECAKSIQENTQTSAVTNELLRNVQKSHERAYIKTQENTEEIARLSERVDGVAKVAEAKISSNKWVICLIISLISVIGGAGAKFLLGSA